MLALVRTGRTPTELAKEFEPSAQTIRNWVKQADLDQGNRSDGLSSDEKAELRKLRKENRRLKEEREILAKATAWFARETSETSTNSSSSSS
jgi:transposase